MKSEGYSPAELFGGLSRLTRKAAETDNDPSEVTEEILSYLIETFKAEYAAVILNNGPFFTAFSPAVSGNQKAEILENIEKGLQDSNPDASAEVPVIRSGIRIGLLRVHFPAPAETDPLTDKLIPFSAVISMIMSDRQVRMNSVPPGNSMPSFIFRSRIMRELTTDVLKMAKTDSPVLITGESGTGKELLAGFIHMNSLRSGKTMVSLNCAAIPDDLLETELFGYKKGSFTDAYEDRPGRVSAAEKGTLFLDEIGELPFALQGKLFRLIEYGVYTPVGSNTERKTDIRIIAATNRDLKSALSRKKLRQDLYFRLNVFSCHLPPLRDRREDIPLLADHFTVQFSRGTRKLDPSVNHVLLSYTWPGNIRELMNVIQRAVTISDNKVLTADDFRLHGHESGQETEPVKNYKDAVNLFKKELITSTLKLYNGNQTKTAVRLGIQRTYLSRLMSEFNISRKE
jgi:transcriptional regulator with PAS, ATPase and Fis domain